MAGFCPGHRVLVLKVLRNGSLWCASTNRFMVFGRRLLSHRSNNACENAHHLSYENMAKHMNHHKQKVSASLASHKGQFDVLVARRYIRQRNAGYGSHMRDALSLFVRFHSTQTDSETDGVRCRLTDAETDMSEDDEKEIYEKTDDWGSASGSEGMDSEAVSDMDLSEVEEDEENEAREEGGEQEDDDEPNGASDSDSLDVETDDELDLDEEIRRQIEPDPKPKKIINRPSVTWGILLTQQQRRITHETVIEYLKGEGINTYELMDIELPITVEVMQQRLGFLRKLGLENDSINHYPLILGCSVRKNMVPVLRYLNKLGLPRHCVAGFLRKYPMILHASIVIDVLPVIYFLRGLDIAREDIPSVLLRYPELLGFRPEGTMSTSVAYLVSIGVKMRHVGRMLTEYPLILGMRVASMIKPRVEYLMSLGLPQMIISKMLERRPQVLGYDLVNRMQHNVDRLLKVGVRKEALPAILAQYPELLGRVLDKTLNARIDWFMKKLKLDLEGSARVIERMPQVIFLQEALALRRIQFLKAQNLTEEDIGVMVTRCPQLLILSVEENLKPNLSFLMNDMKRTLTEVIEFPEYLTYGLETRIRPRHKAAVFKGLQLSLACLFNCTDAEFEKRMTSQHVNEEKAVAFSMGGALPSNPKKQDHRSQPRESERWQPRERERWQPREREPWQPREQERWQPRERRFALS